MLRLAIPLSLILLALAPGRAARAEDDPGPGDASRTIAEWIACLSGACPQTREQAIQALGAKGAEAVPPLLEALMSAVLEKRTGAAEALALIGAPARSAVPILFEMLGDEDDALAVAASRALADLGKTLPSVRARLLKLLEDDDLHRLAAKALARCGAPALPELLPVVQSGERYLRLRILYFVLCDMGEDAVRAVPTLLVLMKQDDEELRQAAEEVMSALEADPELIVASLLEATSADSAKVRFAAVRQLGNYRVGTLDALKAYARLLADEELGIRREAALALAHAEADTSPVVGALLDVVRDPDPDFVAAVGLALSRSTTRQHEVARALVGQLDLPGPPGGRIVDAIVQLGPVAVPLLAARLGSTVAVVRLRAAQALGRIGPQAVAAVPALLDALQGGEAKVHRAAAQAIADIGEPAVGQLMTVLGEKAADRRRRAAMALGALGPTAAPATKPLAKALRDRDQGVRREAATALGRIGPDAAEATASLAKALRDKDPGVRAAVAEGIGGIGPGASKAVKALVKALSDSDSVVQRAAADALGRIGEGAAAAVPDLVRAMRSGKLEVRWRILRALGLIGVEKKGLVSALEQALTDDDMRVRKYAVRALGSLGAAASGSVDLLRELLVDPDADVRAEVKAALDLIQAD